MAVLDIAPTPILALTPTLTALLKHRMESVLTYLINTNSITVYFREAPLLSDFREALEQDAHTGPQTQINLQTFFKTVPLSDYSDYRPFISRLLESPRHKSKVMDLLAPGLPAFVATSSGTAGGAAKYLPKYRHPLSVSSSAVNAMKTCSPLPKRECRQCVIYNLRYAELLDVLDDSVKGTSVAKRIPLCLASSIAFRLYMGWNIENDESLMTTRAPNNTSPLAISFIHSYRTALVMHALFALEDRSIEMINTLFCTTFFDFARLIEEYWDLLVQAIQDGKVPDFEDVEPVEHYLQAQLKPNPKRAAELRIIDRKSSGWFTKVWPNLDRVLGNASGTFARVISQVRHYIGPCVRLQTIGLTSSEAWIAQFYDPRDLNLYKMATDDIFEYLDVIEPEVPESLKQSWEVKVGKAYELVLTTRDGLWRYRLGDVVEIAGFDPTDGQPLIRYSERRNVMMRASGESVKEREIQDAVQSLGDILGSVTEFTVIIDDRPVPRAYGFLVEIEGALGPSASTAAARIHQYLKTINDTYAQYSSRNILNSPTIRILQPGTFQSYREWRGQHSPSGSGQIKVPTVVYDVGVRDWLLERVVNEI